MPQTTEKHWVSVSTFAHARFLWRRDLQSLCAAEVAKLQLTQLQAASYTSSVLPLWLSWWHPANFHRPDINLYHAGIHTHANHFEFWTLALKCTDVLDVFNIDVLSRSWYFWKIWNNKALAASEVKPKRNRHLVRFSRGFNQPLHHMILPSISNFQIRVDQTIQRDLLIPHFKKIKMKAWPLKEPSRMDIEL